MASKESEGIGPFIYKEKLKELEEQATLAIKARQDPMNMNEMQLQGEIVAYLMTLKAAGGYANIPDVVNERGEAILRAAIVKGYVPSELAGTLQEKVTELQAWSGMNPAERKEKVASDLEKRADEIERDAAKAVKELRANAAKRRAA
jgi:hypothetical protein